MIRILFLFFCMLHPSSGATIQFSYVGTGESTDLLGFPVVVSAGDPEIGAFSFATASTVLVRSDLTAFSFSTFFPTKDFFGSPVTYQIGFGVEDLTVFSASLSDGLIESFSFVAEKQVDLVDRFAPGAPRTFNFRFTAGTDGIGFLEAGQAGPLTLIQEGPIAAIPEPQGAFFALILFPFLCAFRCRV